MDIIYGKCNAVVGLYLVSPPAALQVVDSELRNTVVSECNSDLPPVMDTTYCAGIEANGTSAVVNVGVVPHNKEIAGWPRNAVAAHNSAADN